MYRKYFIISTIFRSIDSILVSFQNTMPVLKKSFEELVKSRVWYTYSSLPSYSKATTLASTQEQDTSKTLRVESRRFYLQEVGNELGRKPTLKKVKVLEATEPEVWFHLSSFNIVLSYVHRSMMSSQLCLELWWRR